MANNLIVCEIDESLKELIKKFRFRKDKTDAAIVMRVAKDKDMIILDEEYDDCSIEEVQQELPAAQPRFVAYSYKLDHGDGRISYPMVFIFVTPVGCKPEMQMKYAGSKTHVVKEGGFTKVFELRSAEEFTEEWLKQKLQFFR